MEVLAEETLFVVFKHLSAQDTWRVCLTCSKWKTIWGDRHLWEHFHQRDFGGIPRPPLLPKAWKKSCIDCIVRLAQLSNDDERFSMAVFEGRISLVLGLLASDPSLLYYNEEGARSGLRHEGSFSYPFTNLCWAARGGSLEVFKFFLHKHYPNILVRLRVDRRNILPLREAMIEWFNAAARAESIDILRYLLSLQCFQGLVSGTSSSALDRGHDLFAHGHLEVIRQLLQLGMALTDTSMGKAVESQNEELINLLLPIWTPTDYSSAFQRLVEISLCTKPSIAKKVIQAGLPTAKWPRIIRNSFSGKRPLSKKTVKWMVRKYQAVPNMQHHGWKVDLSEWPLVLEDDEAVKILRYLMQEHLVDVDCVLLRSGKTPLQKATAEGQKEWVRRLLLVGANPLLKGKVGVAPLSMARQMGYGEIARLVEGAVIQKKEDEKKRKRRHSKKTERKGKRRKTNEERAPRHTELRREAENTAKKSVSEKTLKEREAESKLLEAISSIRKLSPKFFDAFRWRPNDFSVFALQLMAQDLQLKPTPSKKAELIEALIVHLREQENVLLYET